MTSAPKKAYKGKNVRISDKAWGKIRQHCFKNGLKMGAFMEAAAIEKIKTKRNEKTNQEN